jgi:hypothetical protein
MATSWHSFVLGVDTNAATVCAPAMRYPGVGGYRVGTGGE